MSAGDESRIEALVRHVAGKRVVVVGNSESLFGQSLGERIDSFDIVLRMNLGFVREPRHQGSRTELLFTSSEKLDADTIVARYAPQWVVWATPKREKMPDLSTLGERLLLHPESVWNGLYQAIAPARPSTGLIALNFLVRQCRCREIAFAGFDFFTSGTFYNRRLFGLLRSSRKASKPHDGEAEQRLVGGMMASGRLYDLAAGS